MGLSCIQSGAFTGFHQYKGLLSLVWKILTGLHKAWTLKSQILKEIYEITFEIDNSTKSFES